MAFYCETWHYAAYLIDGEDLLEGACVGALHVAADGQAAAPDTQIKAVIQCHLK